MQTSRLEAFSDGVLAIMVLELKVPQDPSLDGLAPLLPKVLSYVLSFLYVGIYWNNHHHLMHAATRVTGKVLWANLHLLFWLSLLPFTTGWMGENQLAPLPTALYGVVLFAAAIAYRILQSTIITAQGPQSALKKALGTDWKGKLSPVLYASGIGFTLFAPWLATLLYVGVALLWLVPDRRIEDHLG